MIKKLFLLASVVCVGYFLYFGFQQMKLAQAPQADLYSQIPGDAILVLEVQDLPNQWQDLKTNSLIWDQFQTFRNVSNLEKIIIALDSSYNQQTFNKTPFPSILISISKGEKNINPYLVQFHKPKNLNMADLVSFLSSTFNLKKSFNKNTSEFSLSDNSISLFGYETNGIISISNHQQKLNILKNPKHTFLTSIKSFNKVRKTSSKNVKTKVFVLPEAISASTKNVLNDKNQLEIEMFPELTTWTELDVDFKPDEISMGGFTTASDSLDQWLSVFKDQEPMAPNVLEYFPNKTAFFLHFGFSDFQQLRSKIVAKNDIRSGVNTQAQIQLWDSTYSVSLDQMFNKWIDNEIAVSIIEPEISDVKSEALLWINSSDGMTMINNLKEIALKVDNEDGNDFLQIEYKSYNIFKLNIEPFLETMLGNQFRIITENYFTRIDDYIIFSNSPATLQWCLDRYENKKTLLNDPAFESFIKRISEKSNLFVYSNISKSPEIFKHLTSRNYQQKIDNQLGFFNKFQGLALQVSHESDDLFYINNVLKYHPVNKQMPNTIWETKIAGASHFKPVILKNHYTNAKEIFIQDTTNTIYLIDSKGKVLWSRKLPARIISEVTQIDMYKNNKLQTIFNTQNQIFIIDRNGNNVVNFPIQLQSPTKSAVLVADYDDNNEYRFIIPTTDGEIKNYTTKAEETKGWNYENSNINSLEKISYVRIKGKDYLIVVYEDGSIKALNRRGQTRIQFKSRLNFAPFNGYHLEGGENLASTYILTMTKHQDIVKISLNDTKENLFSINKDSLEHVTFANIDDDPHTEITTSGNNRLTSYTIDGNEITRFSNRHNVSYAPNIYHFNQNHYYGITSIDRDKISLLDKSGEIIAPFPLRGSSPFTITDINNDGRLNLLTIDKSGTIFTYTLD
ncbi:MAG: DUF3352 domain-containing protein [Salibacteraceae bacterium]